MKFTVLTSGDKALGLGDGFILIPTLIDLAKLYNVHHIATNQSYNILKLLNTIPDIHIFNMDQQGHFFTNDFIKTYNLVYWDYYNTLRNFGCHVINATRKIADLDSYSGILPNIPISEEVESAVIELYKNLKRPIVVVQPLISYWNKMIEPYQQQEIVDKLLNLNLTVIQIGGPGISEPYINSKAINLINKTTIEQSIAMIKYADLFVGSDSFCQHAAAFTRTPAVVYWAGTSPKDFGYNFFSNIVYPDIVSCQNKCANPMRWLYNYDYKDKNIWNTRSETGWVCPTKICTKAIKIDDIIVAVNKELEIGHNRDWSFKNYEYTNSTSSIRN